MIDRIGSSGAGIVFVGLGFPKQDHFADAMPRSAASRVVNVGAAFDFHAGLKRSALCWMQSCGLEWFHRLCHEPGRLWRRYLDTNSRFLAKFAAAVLRRALRRGSQRNES